MIGASNVNFPLPPKSEFVFADSDDRSRRDGLIVCGWLFWESFVEDVTGVSVELLCCAGGIDRVVTTCVTAFEKNFSSRYIQS